MAADRPPLPSPPGDPMTRAVLEALPTRVCLLDASGRIVAVNASWERFGREDGGELSLLGPGADYLEACRLAAGRGSTGAAEALAGLGDVLAGRSDSFSLEYACHAPGRPRWFLMRAAPLRLEAGGALVSHLDITDRKLSELAQHETEDRLRAIVDTAADAIISFDGSGRIDSFNAAAGRMFGFDRAEVIGRDIGLLMPPPHQDAPASSPVGHLLGDPGRAVGALRQLVGSRKDGSTFPIELSVGRVDTLDLFTGIIRDVSDRQAMQEQLLTIAEQEQRRIGQDLHDDVGQELTGLALMVESLAEALEEEHSPEVALADRVRAGIRRLQEHVRVLCRGLLPVEVDAEGLMAALDDLAARFRSRQGVDCRFECRQAVAIEDNRTATHLYRIAQEAVSNAVRHGRPRKVVILLEAVGRSVTLEVRDDGDGLPPRAEDGAGMGLRIMRYRAGLIGATLWVGHADGGGTRVVCTLHAEDRHDHDARGQPDAGRGT